MPLNKLENFIKNTEGRILYVNPNDLDATDSISNQGNSLTQPFKTIQRALLESARFSYLRGNDNDIIEKTTVLVYPGEHVIDNRPGYGIRVDPSNSSAAQVISPSGTVSPATTLSLTLTSNFDLTQEDNILYKFNSLHGGVIIPRGTSIVGLDLRKTKVRPKYVPNPTDTSVPDSAIFRVTGACYFWQFSIFDGDETDIVYTDNTDFSSANRSKPTFSHNKLTVFEYADGINDPAGYNRTDLAQYYAKLSNAYGIDSTRDIVAADTYPTNLSGFAPQRPEYEIVGAFAADPVKMASIESGSGGTPGSIITVTTLTAHGLNAQTPIKIKGIPVQDYNISTKVANVISDTQFTYVMPSVRTNLPTNPSASSGTVTIETDNVSGASPYIFNCSMRSVWGMNGMLADGGKATGFKSMVVAQFTGISLQKDDRAFVKFDQTNRDYQGVNINVVRGTNLAAQSSSTDSAKVYHLDSEAVYRKGWGTSHIKITNDAILQIVSVFAIGYQQHFDARSGGDASITNSNSNFGQISLSAQGFKKEAFDKDDTAYVTSVITPRSISGKQTNIDWQSIDVGVTTSVGISSHLYVYGFNNQDDPPSTLLLGYRLGAKVNDEISVKLFDVANQVDVIDTASVFMVDNVITGVSTVSQGTTTSAKKYTVQTLIVDNKINIGAHALETGEKVRIFSHDGDLPENIENNKIYYVIDMGNNSEIRLASSKTNADNAATGADTFIKVYGGSSLYVESRVHDKESGDLGHPIQWDSNNNHWYIHVNTNNTIYTDLLRMGVGGNVGLGAKTPVTTIKRTDDPRGLDEKIYKLRVVVPRHTVNGKNPEEGFIIQESSSTGASADTDFTLTSLTPDADKKYGVLRNLRLIDQCTVSTNVVTVECEVPHDLKVGEHVNIKNVSDTTNTNGLANLGYNGTFAVLSVTDEKTFTYSTTDVDGVAHTIPSTSTNAVSTRSITSPRFERNDNRSNFYVYRNETINEYIEGIQDGIYHLFVIKADNAITEEFTDLTYSQNVVDLYPQRDRDNTEANPPAAKSFAKRTPIGDVVTNELKKSITRESINQFLTDFGAGRRITGVSTSNTVATLTFDRRHNLQGLVGGTVTAGSGYTNGTYHNVKILSGNQAGTWSGALAKVVVSGGQVTSAEITSGGSGYSAGSFFFEQAKIGNGNADARFVVAAAGISNNDGEVVQVTGLSTTTDWYSHITDIPSSTTVALARTTGDPVPSLNQYALNIGPSIAVGSTTNSNTAGITTITCSTGHGLVAGNAFRALDTNNNKLGDFHVKERLSPTVFSSDTTSIGNTTGNIGVPTKLLRLGMTAADAVSDKSNESLAARGLPIYDGEDASLVASVGGGVDTIRIQVPNSGIGTVTRFPMGSYLQIGDEIMRVTSSVLTGADTISVIRGALGTITRSHTAGEVVRKIKPLPIEFRRPSIIRASGHTFEYVGYGPGNYSTGLPQVQVRTLTEREEFLVQSQERSCGTVVYTGMNNRGDFFIGNKRVSSATGQERTFDAPVATITGEDPSRLSVIFDEVVVKDRLIVEGGRTNKILSQFDGPVTFNKEVKINDNLTVVGALKLDSTVKITDDTDAIIPNTTPVVPSKDHGCLVLEGGMGIEKRLNVGGATWISDTLNITDGTVILEAGSSNEGYRIDSGSDIVMSLNRGAGFGDDPVVLKVLDGKRLVLGNNGNGEVQIRDSVTGGNRARFGPNHQILYWNNNEKFRTENSGVKISGITTTTHLNVTGVSTFSGLIDIGSSANIDSDSSATLDGWLAVGQTATFGGNVTAPLFIGDLQGNASTASNLSGNPNINTSGIITCSVLHATNTGAGHGKYVGTGITVAGNMWINGGMDVLGVTTYNSNVHLLDDDILYFGGARGTMDGLEIKHTGGNSYIKDSGTGDLKIQGSPDVVIENTSGANSAVFNTDAGVQLYWRGGSGAGQKFETVQGGANVTGQLDVTGNIRAFTSDIRLKTDIEPITNALSKVDSLNGFTYNHNEVAAALGFDTETRYAGVSAQEVEKVLPEVVSPAPVDENYKTVQYEHIVPLLIEAIKELKAEVEELKKHSH